MTTSTESDTVTERVLHFSVSGDFITGHARDLVQEGNWRKGYEFLRESLDGIDAAVVLDILRGAKKLTGVNTLDLEDDDATAEVQSWLDFQFRHSFYFCDRVYQPYGYVTVFTEDDYFFAREAVQGSQPAIANNANWARAMQTLSQSPDELFFNPWEHEHSELLRYRQAYYLLDRKKDIALCVNVPGKGNLPVFCKEAPEPPLWYRIPRTAQAAQECAIEAYLKGSLEDRNPLDDLLEDDQARVRIVPVERQNFVDLFVVDSKQERLDTLEVLKMQIAHETDNDAEYGWKTYEEHSEKHGKRVSIRVPYRAFICAALSRAKARHLMPDYMPRCPSGLKLPNDCRFHSDAYIGAGLPLDSVYDWDVPETELFFTKLFEVQREMLNFSFDVLARGNDNLVKGKVITDPAQAGPGRILVVATAAPEYAPAALKCAAVIVETGSKLAHLVVVSREESIPVIRVDKACTLFQEGASVTISFQEGTVEISTI